MKWEEAKDKFFLMLKSTKSPKTVKDYRIKLGKVEEFFLKVKGKLPEPDKVTEEDAWRLLGWLREQKKPDGTPLDVNYIRRIYTAFIIFLGFCRNPNIHYLKEFTPKEVRKPIRYLSYEDIKKVLEMFSEADFKEFQMKVLVWIYVFTGMRYSEAIMLRKRDIDIKNAVIYIEKGKGGHKRIVKVYEPLLTLLKRYIVRFDEYMKYRERIGLKTTEYLFFREIRGEIVDPTPDVRAYYRYIVRRAKRVGVDYLNVKMFRSTFAKMLREVGGAPLDVVSAQLGHKRTTTTEEFYHRMGPEGLEEAYRRVVKILKDLKGGDENGENEKTD